MSDEERRCKECGVKVCDVRVDGKWVICDWPPVGPVVNFRRFIVAADGNYAEMKDGKLQDAALTFDGFRVPGVGASIVVVEHDCEALTRLETVYTEHGLKLMKEARCERTA